MLPNPNAEELRFFLCMSAVWACKLCFFRAGLDVPWVEAVYTAVRAFFLGDFTASVMWQLSHYLLSRELLRDKLAVNAFAALPCLALYICVICRVEWRLKRNAEDVQIYVRNICEEPVTFKGSLPISPQGRRERARPWHRHCPTDRGEISGKSVDASRGCLV